VTGVALAVPGVVIRMRRHGRGMRMQRASADVCHRRKDGHGNKNKRHPACRPRHATNVNDAPPSRQA